MTDFEKIGELKRLDIRPGDRFVLTCQSHLTASAVNNIRDLWSGYFKGGEVPELVILYGGVELGVIRVQDAT